MRRCSRKIVPYLLFTQTRDVIEVLPGNGDCFAPQLHADEFGEVCGSMYEKEEVAADAWERSVAVDQALEYEAYLYVEHIYWALTDNALYTRLTHYKELVVCKLQTMKLPGGFESLPNAQNLQSRLIRLV